MAKITLKHPLNIGKIELTEIKMRDHTTAADYLNFDRFGGVDQTIGLIVSLTGHDEEVIKRLHGADYLQLKNEVRKLLDFDESELLTDEEKKLKLEEKEVKKPQELPLRVE